MKKIYTTIGVSQNTRNLINYIMGTLEKNIGLKYTCDEIISRVFKKYANAFISNEIKHYIEESPLDEEEKSILNELQGN